MNKVVLHLLLFVIAFTLSLTGRAEFLPNFERDGLVMMGDMVVDLEEPVDEDYRTRGGVWAKVKPWKDGVLPIQFPKEIQDWQKQRIFEACEVWSEVAKVKCIEGKYKGKKLKLTTKYQGCWSLLGMGSNKWFLKRRMNLSGSCWSKDIIIHELGHAFGLIHEHQRPDRDDFVEVFVDNADGGFLGLNPKVNFGKMEAELSVPYDFFSIMHYPRKAFSKNGKDTILPKSKHSKYKDTMGRAKNISEGDAKTLANLYGAI